MSPEPLLHSLFYELAAIWGLWEHHIGTMTWVCLLPSCAWDSRLWESLNPETWDESEKKSHHDLGRNLNSWGQSWGSGLRH